MNYKVKVNNEAESKEVQGLLQQLGLVNKDWSDMDFPKLISNHVTGEYSDYPMTDCIINQYKELTIPQLKDLVVLKRNSIDDATHACETIHNKKGYLTSDNVEYSWSYVGNHWFISSNSFESKKLKPINKPLKEYLVQQDNGKYALTKATEKRVSDWVEIDSNVNFVTVDNLGRIHTWSGIGLELNHFNDDSIVWTRHTQPEELPFVDDEPNASTHGLSKWFTQEQQARFADGAKKVAESLAKLSKDKKSLNDTYAEIEQVRQDALSIQVGGNHYKNLAIQPVEFAMQNNLDYCQANAIKYIVRHADKNGKEDLLKAKHYIDLIIQHHYSDK